MKITSISKLAILFLFVALLSGCVPHKPRTLWFKVDPVKVDGSQRTFYFALSYILVEQPYRPTEADKYARVIEMAEFWSKSEMHLCLQGITPLDHGYDPKTKRYWLLAECKSEI